MQPESTTTNLSTYNLLVLIDNLKTKLKDYEPPSEGVLKKLGEYDMIEHVYNSNAIEGNSLTLEETALVIEGHTINQKPLRHHLEADSLSKAYLYCELLIKNNTSITENEIKNIHSLVLNHDPINRGEYRKYDVRIGNSVYIPPISEQVPSLMKNLIFEYMAFKLHPIEKIAIFHANFESIHPFIDGNGRTGRLIIDIQLAQNGYPKSKIKFIERTEYYECIETYEINNNSELIIKLIANHVLQELQSQLLMLQKRNNLNSQ